MPSLGGPHRSPASGAPADSLVVMLHGIGDSGDGLIGLADSWAESFPATAFHAPHAPDPFEEAPFGYQWFSRHADRTWVEGLERLTGVVNGYIDGLLDEYHLDASRCVLLGFSQGTIVSLHVAPRRRAALAGAIGFSGFLATSDSLGQELATRTPVCLIHGADDPVLPCQGTEASGQLLNSLGVPTEVHILPGLGHAIDQRGIDHAAQFMRKVLG